MGNFSNWQITGCWVVLRLQASTHEKGSFILTEKNVLETVFPGKVFKMRSIPPRRTCYLPLGNTPHGLRSISLS